MVVSRLNNTQHNNTHVHSHLTIHTCVLFNLSSPQHYLPVVRVCVRKQAIEGVAQSSWGHTHSIVYVCMHRFDYWYTYSTTLCTHSIHTHTLHLHGLYSCLLPRTLLWPPLLSTWSGVQPASSCNCLPVVCRLVALQKPQTCAHVWQLM